MALDGVVEAHTGAVLLGIGRHAGNTAAAPSATTGAPAGGAAGD